MLYGRGDEQRVIAGVIVRARAGEGGALLLHGEAGVGKSALLAHAGEQGRGMLTLRAQGLESESELAFAGLAALLEPVVATRAQLPEVQRQALEGALALGPAWAGEPFTIYRAAATLLTEAARRQPLLALVDDVQWLDGASQQALHFVARRTAGAAVALVMTRRDEGPAPEPWPGVEDLHVRGLSTPAALELLADHGVEAAVARRVADATAGNALALTEVPRLLTEAQRTGHDPLDDPLPLGDRLVAAFSARAASLPHETRSALLLAAASDSGDLAAIEPALAERGSGLAALEPAERGGLVELGAGGLVFAHPLVRAAVVAGAPAADRRAAHAALARHTTGDARAWHRAAAAAAPDETVAAELDAVAAEARSRGALSASSAAWERAASLTPAKAARVGRRLHAALDALEDGQVERAIALLDAGLAEADDPLVRADAELLRGTADMLRGHPMRAHERLRAEARRVEPLDGGRAARMLCQAGIAFMAVGGKDELVDISKEARAIALAAGDEAAAILPTIQLGLSYIAGNEWHRGRELLDRYDGFLRDVDPLGPMNEVLGMVAMAFMWGGDLDRADEAVERQVATARAAGATRALAFPLAVKAAIHGRRGDLRLAELAGDEAVGLAEETAGGMVLSFALGLAARIDAARGNEQRCRTRAERSVAIARSLGLDAVAPYALLALGALELLCGNLDAALDFSRAADEQARAAGQTEQGCQLATPDWTEAAIRARRLGDARAGIAVLEADAADSDRPLTGAVLARCRGALAGDDGFDRDFEEALALHERVPARVERARTLLLYGERLRRARRRAEAGERLGEAVGEFERAGAAPWAARARRELDAATAGGRRVAASAGGPEEPLTAQERRIAGLVETGATNREIAEELYLSPRTVEFHLRGAFRKLGVRTRTELVAAMRKGAA